MLHVGAVHNVAELFGDTEEMVGRYYAAGIPEGQDRLAAVLREALADKPELRLVEGGPPAPFQLHQASIHSPRRISTSKAMRE